MLFECTKCCNFIATADLFVVDVDAVSDDNKSFLKNSITVEIQQNFKLSNALNTEAYFRRTKEL